MRGITCNLPPTLRYLPPHKPGQHPALIAAFGLVEEVESEMVLCGPPAMEEFCLDDLPAATPAEDTPWEMRADSMVMNVGDVTAVHLTLLKPDGSGKADVKPNKIVVGSPGRGADRPRVAE